MALREELEVTGGWLFRWRSYLPLVLVLPTALAMAEPQRPFATGAAQELWEGICLAVAALGLAIRAITVAHVPQGTSGRNTRRQVARVLNTSGMYSIVRHPLYLGNFFIGLGFSMFCCRWWLVALYVLLFGMYYERIVFFEEEFLRRKFGERFLRWAAATPAFVPRFARWRPAELPFSLRNVLRREYSAVLSIAGGFLGLEIMQQAIVEGRLAIRPFWNLLALAALVTYSLLRLLKMKTRLLHVEER